MHSTLKEIASIVEGTLIGEDGEFQNISIDTRTLNTGELFVAIVGENFDGHQFVAKAAEKAAAVLVTKEQKIPVPQIIVKDTRVALAEMAKVWRKKLAIPAIALTGSSGKTTTKSIIESILAQFGEINASQGSFNNDIGLPLTIFDATGTEKFALYELGSNHLGEIKCLSDIAMPQVALVNNIAPAHLAGFNSMIGVAEEKSDIFHSLPKDGIAIVNADQLEFIALFKEKIAKRKIISFGKHSDADVRVELIELNAAAEARFNLFYKGHKTEIQLSLPGEHNMLNTAAASAAVFAIMEFVNSQKKSDAAAVLLNIADILDAIATAVSQLGPIKGRMNAHHLNRGLIIIDDTYNANPSSVLAALAALKEYPGERYCVLGDLAELGPDGQQYMASIAQEAKTMGIDGFFSCGEVSKIAAENFGENAQNFPSKKALVDYLQKNITHNATLLIKGSRSAAMEYVVEQLLNGEV